MCHIAPESKGGRETVGTEWQWTCTSSKYFKFHTVRGSGRGVLDYFKIVERWSLFHSHYKVLERFAIN